MNTYTEKGFIEFQKRFQNDDQCLEYLKTTRWPDGFICPKCGHTEAYWIDTRKLFQCKQCGRQTSLTAHTIFHKSHLPLWKWFWAIYLIGTDRRGISAKLLERLLEIPYSTAWPLLHKIRNAMEDRDSRYLLEHVVEMDEAFFGAQPPGNEAVGLKIKRK